MPRTRVSDISVYYEMHGDEGSPVLMIAGLALSKVDWFPEFIDRLKAQHRVIIFDNRGVGQSDKPTSGYTMAQFATDSIGLLDALKIDKAHVLGMSLGGMIAQHMAIGRPDRVWSLVLGCSIPGFQDLVHPTRQVAPPLGESRAEDRARDIRSAWTVVYTPAFVTSQRARLEKMLEVQLAYPAPPDYVLRLQFESIVNTHNITREQLSAIGCPVLVQCGTEDILVPPVNSRLLARLIPRAELIEYPGCGHGFTEEAAPKPAEDVLRFLAIVDQRSGYSQPRLSKS